MNKIKMIAFDVGGVILEDGFFKLFEFLKKDFSQKITFEFFDETFIQCKFAQNLRKGLITSDQYWEYISLELKRVYKKSLFSKYTKGQLMKILIDGFTLNQNTVDVIKILKNEDYKIAIMSNDFYEKEKIFKYKFDYYNYIDILIFSYKINEAKPNKEFFKKALSKISFAAEEIIFIDDRLENITTASTFGFNTIHFNGISLEKEIRNFL